MHVHTDIRNQYMCMIYAYPKTCTGKRSKTCNYIRHLGPLGTLSEENGGRSTGKAVEPAVLGHLQPTGCMGAFPHFFKGTLRILA